MLFLLQRLVGTRVLLLGLIFLHLVSLNLWLRLSLVASTITCRLFASLVICHFFHDFSDNLGLSLLFLSSLLLLWLFLRLLNLLFYFGFDYLSSLFRLRSLFSLVSVSALTFLEGWFVKSLRLRSLVAY